MIELLCTDYNKKATSIHYYFGNAVLDTILRSDNLNAAYKKVKTNKGVGGIDEMQVDELLPCLREHQSELVEQVREGKYKPNPVRRVEIPKEEKGKTRKLGIPTVCVVCGSSGYSFPGDRKYHPLLASFPECKIRISA
uniref:hypothetical protein n=1 Tax=Enterocloster clostridioformis TaxID=1531 RepID=UPI0033334FDB